MNGWVEQLHAIDWFPLWLSLRVASLATLVSLLVGILLAYLMAKREFRGKETLDALLTLPLILPPTVLGYYLLISLGRNSFIGVWWEKLFGTSLVFTWQAAVIAAAVHSLPLLVKSARAALEGVDTQLENAARLLGATEIRVFWRVTLPLAWHSVLAAAILCFARSLGDFGVTIMIAGNIPGKTQTMAIAIYDAVQAGNTFAANVLVSIISLIALIIFYITNRLARGRVL